jgi:hypothetical protein
MVARTAYGGKPCVVEMSDEWFIGLEQEVF